MQSEHLAKENAAQHASIVRRAQKAIGDLRASGRKVSFYSVAKEAQVARSTLYRREDLRKLVEEARSGRETPGAAARAADARIVELEKKLAEVTAERDALASRDRRMASARYYAVVCLNEAA